MKLIITESQLKTIVEQQTPNLTVPEQTLLGFLNRFLRGEDGEFENTPAGQLKKTMMFNSKTIYPMAQALLVKKNTDKKTYDDKTFNALFMAMDKSITKEQRYEFFKEGGSISNVKYNSIYEQSDLAFDRKYGTADAAEKSNKENRELIDTIGGPHRVLELMSIGSIFIPVVGPLISMGLGFADSAVYMKEGKKKEAAVAAILSILPQVSEVVSSIPAVKQLGQKGMQVLANKLASNMELGMLEKRALEDILRKKSMVYKAVQDYTKKAVYNGSQKLATLPPAQQVILKTVADGGIGQLKTTVNTAAVNGIINRITK
jgi:hypothetical protein